MVRLAFSELMNILQCSGENERIEAKRTSNTIGKSVLETISAFCNEPGLGGGYLILGLTKNTGEHSPLYEVSGVGDADKLQSEIASLCRQNFSMQIRPDLRVLSHEDKNIVLIYIPEAEPHEKPVFIKSKGVDKGTYRRIGPTDQLCTHTDLDDLYRKRSRRKFDDELVDASFDDVDPAALIAYRRMREEVNNNAEELRYHNEDLLQGLSVLIPTKGVKLLTLAGLVLFGKPMSLRRVLPVATRVDYIMIEGTDWVPDPDKRYHALEIRESLLTGIPRLLQHIMNDIPQAFALDDEEIFRKDNPIIPRKVIREAVCNCLMHRDYSINSPIQIRRYANRIEFENAGYSLKPEDQLGLPGSITRNSTIATILHEVNLAETKGTGIRTMRDTMEEINLSIPMIESDRPYNKFSLTLLTHHFFNEKDIAWLANFKECDLTNEEARALIALREMQALTNADFRTINRVDTLAASTSLRKLRDLGMLIQKGGGASTYYIPGDRFFGKAATSQVMTKAAQVAERASQVNEVDIPYDLQIRLESLGKRNPPETIKSLIREICALGDTTPAVLAELLQKNPAHLKDAYLYSMVESGQLEYVYPDQPQHPRQAYRTRPTP